LNKNKLEETLKKVFIKKIQESKECLDEECGCGEGKQLQEIGLGPEGNNLDLQDEVASLRADVDQLEYLVQKIYAKLGGQLKKM